MRYALILAAIFIAFAAAAQEPTSQLGADFQAKRDALPSFHEEFQIKETINNGIIAEDSQYRIAIDVAQTKWHASSVSSFGNRLWIFDGQNLFRMQAGGQEYVNVKPTSKDKPQPPVYEAMEVDWTKAKELQRGPCGLAKINHTCILIEAPARKYTHSTTGGTVRVMNGTSRFVVDPETGLLIQSHTVETVENLENPEDGPNDYSLDTIVTLTGLSYGAPADPGLFQLPSSGIHEVQELSGWDVDNLKKQLVGKQAPDLHVTDIHGNRVSLSDFKGKTVLLDFWTSWCPPCRTDGPPLDKLYAKYASKNLAIIGISVDEDRDTVEKFLKKYPLSFPVVLSSENEMPRPYEIPVIPTYIVITPDGTVATAVAGGKSFGELRKFLQKAGMETD